MKKYVNRNPELYFVPKRNHIVTLFPCDSEACAHDPSVPTITGITRVFIPATEQYIQNCSDIFTKFLYFIEIGAIESLCSGMGDCWYIVGKKQLVLEQVTSQSLSVLEMWWWWWCWVC